LNKEKTYTATIIDTKTSSKWGDYVQLVKVRLTFLVVFSSAMAYIIAAAGAFQWKEFAMLCIGGFFVAGAANAFNQILEKDYDKLMKRTSTRPLPTGRMTVNEAIIAAGLMSLIGLTFLGMLNPLAAFLGSLAMLIYSFVYTPLKRHHPVSVTVGGFAGALPTMIGVTALEGSITYLAITLFAIQFLWQYAHFWAIGYLGFEDYKKAGFNLVPEEDGHVKRSLGLQSFLWTILLVPIVLFAQIYFNIGSPISSYIVVGFSVLYALTAINFHIKFDRKSAFLMMMSSFIYLPVVLITYSVI